MRKKTLESITKKMIEESLGFMTPPSEKPEGLGFVKPDYDVKDVVTVDVPLLIRLLEYAREDAKDDQDLHRVAERLINQSKSGPLSMKDYRRIIQGGNQ